MPQKGRVNFQKIVSVEFYRHQATDVKGRWGEIVKSPCGMILKEARKGVKRRRIKADAEMCSHNKFYKQENNEESAAW